MLRTRRLRDLPSAKVCSDCGMVVIRISMVDIYVLSLHADTLYRIDYLDSAYTLLDRCELSVHM